MGVVRGTDQQGTGVYVDALSFNWAFPEIHITSVSKWEPWQEVYEGLLIHFWFQRMKLENEKEIMCYVNHSGIVSNC